MSDHFATLRSKGLTLFCSYIYQFGLLTWMHVRKVTYHFQSGLVLTIDYMIIFNSFTWNENFSSVCSNRGKISAWFIVMKVFHIIVILFLHFPHLTCEMKSHHGLISWNFSPVWKSSYDQPLKWSFLKKLLNIFAKRFHVRCLTEFWMRLCSVRVNPFVPNEPFLYHLKTCFQRVEKECIGKK